jgi:hypothetical protein
VCTSELSIVELAEVMEKVANVHVPETALKEITHFLDTHAESQSRQARTYLAELLDADGMVDPFVEFYPTARYRATCWDQHTNNRYSNVGGRIDYILVDRPFFDKFVLRGEAGLDTGGRPDLDPLSEAAALSACTLNSQWQPAPFGGGGIADAPQKCYDHHFRPPSTGASGRRAGRMHPPPAAASSTCACAGTGMIYTPPQYSDHIAVALLLHRDCLSFPLDPDRRFDSNTRRCQPHAAMKSITSYFQRQPSGAGAPPPLSASSSTPTEATNSDPATAAAAQKRKPEEPTSAPPAKKGLLRFFKAA